MHTQASMAIESAPDATPSARPSAGRCTRRQGLKLTAAAGLAAATIAKRAPAADAPPAPPRVWDGHCHLYPGTGDSPGGRLGTLLEYADRMGVERLVVFMGWPFAFDPAPEDMRRQNDQVLDALAAWPERALGYAYISPAHVDFSLAEMERCIARGPMVGLKLWVARKCNDPAIDPIVRRAVELRVPIYQHTWIKATGNLPGESTPMELAELARRHPDAVLFCGHAGGDWEQGIRAVRPCPNVYLDTAGGDPAAGIVEMAVRELGADRVVYGSDVAGRGFASQLAKVEDLTPRQREQILGGNLRRLLAPALAARQGRG